MQLRYDPDKRVIEVLGEHGLQSPYEIAEGPLEVRLLRPRRQIVGDLAQQTCAYKSIASRAEKLTHTFQSCRPLADGRARHEQLVKVGDASRNERSEANFTCHGLQSGRSHSLYRTM